MSVLQEQLSLSPKKDEAMVVFQKLNDARIEIKQYLPKDFDPDKELTDIITFHSISNLWYIMRKVIENVSLQEMLLISTIQKFQQFL